MITKPLLAGTVNNNELDKIKFPCLATPKIDGIRAMKINGKIVSRTLKPIKNEYISNLLNEVLPDNSDGEIYFDDSTFQDISSRVMSKESKNENDKVIIYYWFDYVKDSPNKPYKERVLTDMLEYMKTNFDKIEKYKNVITIIPLYPKEISTVKELLKYEGLILDQNYEGVMIRNMEGKYKMGRSTLKEGILLKFKRFMDSEAEVIGYEELMLNKNDKNVETKERSHKKSGLINGGTLGSFILKTKDDITFNVGSGLTKNQRDSLWKNKEELIGKIVKYKYFNVGVKTAPRFPVFLGFRDQDDM